jgi:predicted phosphodiesterase
MAQYPYTLLIAGHTHTFAYYKNERQMIVGNGGAPLAGSVNYGYVIGRQRADGAIEFREYDYATNAVNTTFAVKADGSAAP